MSLKLNQIDKYFKRINVKNRNNREKSKPTSKTRISKYLNSSQMLIDVGQRDIRPSKCDECDMVFVQADPIDRMIHKRIHDDMNMEFYLNIPKDFRRDFMKEQNIEIIIYNNKNLKKTNCESGIDVAISKQLSLMRVKFDDIFGLKNYNSASRRKSIVTFLSIKKYCSSETKFEVIGFCDVEKAVCSSYFKPHEKNILIPAKCSIKRIWTKPQYRRCGIASKTIDKLRESYNYNFVLDKNLVCWTQVTDDVIPFAEHYFHCVSIKANFN
ncbi:hypothetical protein A3Q56_02100 [Intoshia linei]|uniref:Uncharacterized protein n=1 Tax=Intoshia linei TaxID=1819745 RepID=A0A177B923_9BILA|nr:hypothetical protein A3Q56_02100 [Intoshia linei]